MTAEAKKILEQALALSEEERILVYEGLGESLEQGPDLHPSWDAEIRRRIAAVEAGEEETIPAEVVMEEARRMLRGS